MTFFNGNVLVVASSDAYAPALMKLVVAFDEVKVLNVLDDELIIVVKERED